MSFMAFLTKKLNINTGVDDSTFTPEEFPNISLEMFGLFNAKWTAIPPPQEFPTTVKSFKSNSLINWRKNFA